MGVGGCGCECEYVDVDVDVNERGGSTFEREVFYIT